MRNNLQDYGYVSLNKEATEKFIQASVKLLDDVYNTQDDDFSIFAANNYEWLLQDPSEVFTKFFDSLEQLDLDKYQAGFLEYARINYGTMLKWYKKNAGTINMSEKQAAWIKKWFTKHGIQADFIPSPVKVNITKPNLGV